MDISKKTKIDFSRMNKYFKQLKNANNDVDRDNSIQGLSRELMKIINKNENIDLESEKKLKKFINSILNQLNN